MGKFPSSKALAIHRGKILAYLRDDIPEISDPNKWDLPGVDLCPGETFSEAMKRAFHEQFNIVPEDIRFLGKIKSPEGPEHALYLAFLSDGEVSALSLGNRGQEFGFFGFKEIQKAGLTEPLRRYFDKFGDYLRSILEGNISYDAIDPGKLGLYRDQ